MGTASMLAGVLAIVPAKESESAPRARRTPRAAHTDVGEKLACREFSIRIESSRRPNFGTAPWSL